jgi:8-oxo-dGTP diphosphatase
MKKQYVAGFLFDANAKHVALIEKQRPAWQKWQLNGIGGKIELHESAAAAMQREFLEETGLLIEQWKLFCVLEGSDFEVMFFYGFDSRVHNVESKTDETVAVFEVAGCLDPRITHPLIPNLRWLIPMALSMIYTPGIAAYHVQEEVFVAHV